MVGLPQAVEVLIVSSANHLTLMGDGLDIIFILMARLIKGMLRMQRKYS